MALPDERKVIQYTRLRIPERDDHRYFCAYCTRTMAQTRGELTRISKDGKETRRWQICDPCAQELAMALVTGGAQWPRKQTN